MQTISVVWCDVEKIWSADLWYERNSEAIKNTPSLGKIEESLFQEIEADTKITVKDLTLNPMRTSHDAAEPVAYRISHGRKSGNYYGSWVL